MSWSFLNNLQWWMPIPWVLAAASATIAVLAFRRSRLPHVRIHRLAVECTARHPDWRNHEYLNLDLLCLGADIFDLEAYCECDYSYRRGWWRYPVSRHSRFVPIGTLPNPVKNGQIVRFETADHEYRFLQDRRYADIRVPSQLWPGRVRIAVYHSGKRLLLSHSSWRFRSLLKQFDSLGREDGAAPSPYPKVQLPVERYDAAQQPVAADAPRATCPLQREH